MYDSTSSATFDSVDYWVKELAERGQQNIVMAVVASKIDMDEKEAIPIKRAAEYAKKIGAKYYQTSAKDGSGIDALFKDISTELYTKVLAGEYD